MLFSIFVEKKSYHDYKIVAISYGDKKFIKQLKINEFTAINVGKVNEYYSYCDCSHPGDGNWLWISFVLQQEER